VNKFTAYFVACQLRLELVYS